MTNCKQMRDGHPIKWHNIYFLLCSRSKRGVNGGNCSRQITCQTLEAPNEERFQKHEKMLPIEHLQMQNEWECLAEVCSSSFSIGTESLEEQIEYINTYPWFNTPT